ncbi:transposase [Elusimicrobiota bacterium]
MPRSARVDWPGAIQHIMARGIEKRDIFNTNRDYESFIERLGEGVVKYHIQCFAWVLIPNHIHLCVRSGPKGIAPLMRSVLTGHANYFNKKYERVGHLFQNRYKSKICEDEAQLFCLIRYIHSNPLRAGFVESVSRLSAYPWSGHSSIMGLGSMPWQDVNAVLLEFGDTHKKARRAYTQFLRQDEAEDDIKKFGMFSSVQNNSADDDLVLSKNDLAQSILEKAEERMEISNKLSRLSIEEIVRLISQKHEIPYYKLLIKGRKLNISKAKAELIYIGTEYLGKSLQEMAGLTKMTKQSAYNASLRAHQAFDPGTLSVLSVYASKLTKLTTSPE